MVRAALLRKFGTFAAYGAFAWITYNAYIFIAVVYGPQGEYIPYLNFPIKLFAMLAERA